MKQQFSDGIGDMFVSGRRGGLVNVTYMHGGSTAYIGGFASWHSEDGANTLTRGEGIAGEYDREWLVAAPNGQLFMDYSKGYIGGPKSEGVFLSTSLDNGQTFSETSRVDDAPEGSYAVDPYLIYTGDGRICAMWEVSKDYDTMEGFRLAYSLDGGQTFTGHKTIAEFPKEVGGQKVDNQERWTMGAICALGGHTIVVVYPGYEQIKVDDKAEIAFVDHYRYSTDGGVTFSKPATILSSEELQNAVRSFRENLKASVNNAYYTEVLPWICSDKKGGVHFVFTDNRAGQGLIDTKPYSSWQVRWTASANLSKGFEPSQAVSEPYVAIRPPMDFLSCCADSKYFYVSWTEDPGWTTDWPNAAFSGNLKVRRLALR
jgi:hypothetical protein